VCDYDETDLGAPTSIRVNIDDPDESGVFQFYLDGTEKSQTYSASWTTGDPQANAERHGATDSGNADIHSLQYATGSGCSSAPCWYDWDSSAVLVDCDSGYDAQVTGDLTYFEVRSGSGGYVNKSACSETL